MFCRKCGKTLLDGDRFCSYCGAQVIERTESAGGDENLEEVIYNDSSKPVEPLGAVVPKKSIVQAWQEKSESSTSKSQIWNLQGFPSASEEARKTEEIVVDWDNRSVDTEPEQKVEIVEIGDKLEPIKKKEEVAEEENIAGLDLETELFGRRTNLQFEPNQTSTDSIEKFYTFSKKNEEFQKLLDKEYDRLKKGGLPERKEPINLEKLEIQPKCEENVTGIEKILQATTIESEKVEINLEPQILKEQQSQPVEKSGDEKLTNPIPFMEQANEPEPEVNTAQTPECNSQEIIEDAKAENTNEVIFPWDEISSVRQEFVDDEANKKKISPVKVIISVVIVLLVFEIGILGVKYFFPESGAAALINEKLGSAVNWVDVLKNSSDSKEPLEEDAKKTDEAAEVVAKVVPNAERTLTEVLDPLRVYNNNIKSISVNETLVYDKNKDYGDKNINNSTPIEDNIWYQDESGNDVYFDSEIFKTLISFNSLWIDYLNGKNSDVLLQTKEDSSAYKKVKTFSKVGKISEVFNNLELGEMRKGNKGYYIWVKEEIQVTENSTVKNKVINNIYYLEPVEQELKIVNYIEY